MTNTTYQLCLWADYLFAMDRVWWDQYVDDVNRRFKGKCYTLCKKCHNIPVAPVMNYQNSGAGAVALAAALGASSIILMGYDMGYAGGKRHWHGDHPPGLGNAGKVKNWPAHFEPLARRLTRINVLNCSRKTALKCFPRAELEQVLNEHH